MKKKIFITFLLLSVFLFQGCVEKISQLLSDIHLQEIKYLFYNLDAKRWIDVTPKKEIYKVGDTVTIIYKIPSRIGKYTESGLFTKRDLKKEFNKEYKDFDIYKDTKQENLNIYGFNFMCNSRFLNCERDKGNPKKDLIVILNGKEIKDREERKYFIYNSKSKEYIMDLKLIFLKPCVFYWKTPYTAPIPKALNLIPEVRTELVNVKNNYKHNTLLIRYTESEKLAFKVIE